MPRGAGSDSPRARVITASTTPATIHRTPPRSAGGSASRLNRIARYVVPQITQTATSAAYALRGGALTASPPRRWGWPERETRALLDRLENDRRARRPDALDRSDSLAEDLRQVLGIARANLQQTGNHRRRPDALRALRGSRPGCRSPALRRGGPWSGLRRRRAAADRALGDRARSRSRGRRRVPRACECARAPRRARGPRSGRSPPAGFARCPEAGRVSGDQRDQASERLCNRITRINNAVNRLNNIQL